MNYEGRRMKDDEMIGALSGNRLVRRLPSLAAASDDYEP
jgi:hypothetical protein